MNISYKNIILLLILVSIVSYGQSISAANSDLRIEIVGGGKLMTDAGEINTTENLTYATGRVAMIYPINTDTTIFLGWSGDCAGSAACVVNMGGGDRKVIAQFGPTPNTKELNPPKILYPTGDIAGTTSVTIAWENIANEYMIRMAETIKSDSNIYSDATQIIKNDSKINSSKETYSVIPGRTYRFWIYSGRIIDHSTKYSEIIFKVDNTYTPSGPQVVTTQHVVAKPRSTETSSPVLSFGQTSKDVIKLQKFLNSKGITVATKGAGSKGKESTYFGALTVKALIRFQKSEGIPATGRLDALTRSYVGL